MSSEYQESCGTCFCLILEVRDLGADRMHLRNFVRLRHATLIL